jgi:GWxTD domain-containing protein
MLLSQFWISHFWIQRLGWALLHFLWQGTAIAIAYAILRRLLAGSLAAQGRYVLGCMALGAMTVAPAVTFFMVPAAHITLWPSPVPASEWQRLLPGVVALWLSGVLVSSLRLLGAWRFTARLRSAAHPAPHEWQQTVERIAACVGARQAVRLLISSMVDVPTVIGWLRPVILVPVEFFIGLPVEHIKALLAHEIAHIRRLDYLVSVLQSIAEAVLFYHPAVWWISEQIRAERELCCDDIAVAVGGDVFTYASALAELESRHPARLKTALAANGGSLVNRIRRLIEPESARARSNNLPGPGAAWAMILLWIAGVGVSAVHAAQTPAIVPHPVELSADPLPTLASHARNTLLFDPFLSAQLEQPAPADTDRAQKEAALKKELETPQQKWLNEDVVYIITDEERRAFMRLNTDAEREQFVEQFWLRRDPTPDTIQNEFKEEQYRRIAYANEHFSWDSPGWKTDRGRIYITFGPPDEIDAHPSGGAYNRPTAEGGGETTTFPFEDWRYRHLAGIGDNIAIEFVDTRMNGEYHMTMDPSEKDALNYVPGAGLTLAEQLGLRDKMARFMGAPLGAAPAANNQFERLQQFGGALQRAPQVNLDDPADAIGKLPTYEMLPMQVRTDFLRVTASSVLANFTIGFDARDLKFDRQNGKSNVTIMGRVSTIELRPVTTFERSLETDAKAGQQGALFAQSVPLAPGQYRMKILARDAISGRVGTYEAALDVPHYDEGKLASSSLILADTVGRHPVNSIGGAMFAIGGSTVRPRPSNRFTGDEKLGIYFQIYNFRPDETAGKLSGSIEYEIDNAGTNERVMGFSEEAGSIANASSSQVTVEKMIPLKTFAPGSYTLKVTATDRIGNQTLRRQGNFAVSAAASR